MATITVESEQFAPFVSNGFAASSSPCNCAPMGKAGRGTQVSDERWAGGTCSTYSVLLCDPGPCYLTRRFSDFGREQASGGSSRQRRLGFRRRWSFESAGLLALLRRLSSELLKFRSSTSRGAPPDGILLVVAATPVAANSASKSLRDINRLLGRIP